MGIHEREAALRQWAAGSSAADAPSATESVQKVPPVSSRRVKIESAMRGSGISAREGKELVLDPSTAAVLVDNPQSLDVFLRRIEAMGFRFGIEPPAQSSTQTTVPATTLGGDQRAKTESGDASEEEGREAGGGTAPSAAESSSERS